jgi:hypothetical protein
MAGRARRSHDRAASQNPDRATGCGRTVLPVASRRVPWRKVLSWLGLLVTVAVVVAVGIYVVFWPLSDWIARHNVGAITGPHRAAALQAAREAAQGHLLTLGAGLFAAGALAFTAWNLTLYRHSLTLYRRTNEITEQGQVTDRYTKAIEQLGSPDKPDVRIGAVYALERIARDSATDHPTVMEVLSAFIREHSREQWPPPDADEAATYPVPQTRPDVQAAITVIGRRDINRDRYRYRVDLTDANLPFADLTGADLSGADLIGANLTRAKLTGAKLTGADLTNADLTNADLTNADLTGANLTDAKLTDANLTGAKLTGAKLTGVGLTSADLSGANLTGANLTGAELTGARWPPDAAVPEGWQRDTRRGLSGRLKRADTDSGGAATD